MTSKYTFLLAAFKAKYLAEAIESILSQSYPNFRLVVSDDCSPEDIKGIVSQFNDDRLEYVRNEKNIGGYNLVDHWNLQLQRDAIDSEYVIMASDDDVYAPDFLSSIEKLTIAYPQVDLLRGRCVNADEHLEPIVIDDPSDTFQNELHFAADMYNGRHIRSFANFVFKAQALKDKGGFIKFPYAWYSDAVSTIMMSVNGVANTQTPVFYYRSSDMAISGTTRNKTITTGKMEAALMYYQWMSIYIDNLKFDKNKLNEHYQKELIHLFRHDSFATIISYFWAFSIVGILKIIKELRKSKYFSTPSFGKELFVFYMGKFASL